MADTLDFTSSYGRAPGDDYFTRQAETMVPESSLVNPAGPHKMDGPDAKAELRKLLEWFYYEKDKQAFNRLEMATDADFYDNLQWDPEDAQTLKDRGQMPLVYNEVAPMCDWLIGTERRTRVDWKVLPRREDGVHDADIKTKVLKYVSDINRTAWARSRAFADAIKVGVGWVDDGVRDDPTKDVLYSRYEDWRRVLWDSQAYELGLEDARYIFRWRMVDEDVALLSFPDRQDVIRRGIEDARKMAKGDWDELSWYAPIDPFGGRSGTIYARGSGMAVDAKRRQVRIIECQYRRPVPVKVVADGPLKGALFDQRDAGLVDTIARRGDPLIDRVMMRVHVACFTDTAMLSLGPSVFRHNSFSLTPIWCYRRGRDRLPYGVIRRVRDVQQDLNKRASKALFLLNTNQIIMDEGAVQDIDVAADEVSRPDGRIVKKPGKEFLIRRDTDAANGQIEMMNLAAQSIQKSAGVADENLGRQTNAVSGEAIKARQLQGSVVTTEPFDNLRLAIQIQGEKQLSLVEQWYSDEKVVRLTGEKALEWVNINTPEVQNDGSTRYINDITERAADFVVSEQDYSGTLRQVMFDALNNVAQRLPPEVALRMLRMAYEYSDLPNKNEIADELRQLTGERDPNKPMTPEEQRQAEQQQQMQIEALQMQRDQGLALLDEQRAKARELNARAAKLESEAAAGTDTSAIDGVRAQLSNEIDRLSQDLRTAQAELVNETLRIRTQADTDLERARIDAASRERCAEIQAASDQRLAAISDRLAALEAPKKPTK